MGRLTRRRALAGIVAIGLGLVVGGPARAGGEPPLDARGRAGFAEYRAAEGHRAFAVAPGGAWAWRGDLPSPELARQAALADCQAHARRPCLIYAQDDRVVLDPGAWAGAWRPYASRAQAERAAEGVKPGQRFPDLAYLDPAGTPRRLSDDQGAVRVLHFWGSWCPPCQGEMPDLERLYRQLKGVRNLRFLFLPVREPVARSRDWVKRRGFDLPVADGGASAARDGAFRLADGRRLADRALAGVFPTTYVLDRHGLVLFVQQGPVADWAALAPLLKDAAAGSGRP